MPHGQPNFEAMAQWWSSAADGTSIFYKLKEHLATYYRTWMEHQLANRSLVGSERQRQPNTKQIMSLNHAATVLAAASRQYPGLQDNSTPAVQTGRAESREENLEVESDTPGAEPMEDTQEMAITYPEDTPMEVDSQANNIVPQLQISQGHNTHFMSWSLGEVGRKQRHCSVCKKCTCPERNNRKRCPDYFQVSYPIY